MYDNSLETKLQDRQNEVISFLFFIFGKGKKGEQKHSPDNTWM